MRGRVINKPTGPINRCCREEESFYGREGQRQVVGVAADVAGRDSDQPTRDTCCWRGPNKRAFDLTNCSRAGRRISPSRAEPSRARAQFQPARCSFAFRSLPPPVRAGSSSPPPAEELILKSLISESGPRGARKVTSSRKCRSAATLPESRPERADETDTCCRLRGPPWAIALGPAN